MNTFLQKKVFITGGSSGIGLATAKHLAKKGADITIFARDEGRLQASVEELKKNAVNKNQLFNWFVADVADNDDINTKISQAVSDFNIPDIFINFAGISVADKFENISADKFDHLIRVNLAGTRNATASILPYMKKKGGGTIVIVASTAGLIPVYGYTAYGTSKYALIGLAECLRVELKPDNIDVAVLCPPEVDTPLVEVDEKTSPPETKILKQMAGKLTADYTARSLLRGLEKGTFMIIPGFRAKTLYYTRIFCPGFIFRGSSDLLVWLAQKKKKALKLNPPHANL